MNAANDISAVIIALNEEKYIERCIRSIIPVTNDIVVVDSGSTDRTVQLAMTAGARVYYMDWEGYGANKNYGNHLAEHKWILSIDADEILDEELQFQLFHLKKSKDTIYQIKSLVNYAGNWIHHCGWHPGWKNRLFYTDFASWNLDPVHEDLITKHPAKYIQLDGQLLHYSYDSVFAHKRKAIKYATLKAQGWIDKGTPPNLLKRWLGPSFRFWRTYILKLGFLDGRSGYIISKIDAMIIRYAIKQYDLKKTAP